LTDFFTSASAGKAFAFEREKQRARFKETCSRSKRHRRYLKSKPGAAPQEFKSPCKQALKARFNWR